MKLIPFPEQTVVIAKNQPEYLPFPAHKFDGDSMGRIAACWQLTWKERLRLLFTGKIWHQIATFDNPLQPQLLTVEKPAMPPRSTPASESGCPAKACACLAALLCLASVSARAQTNTNTVTVTLTNINPQLGAIVQTLEPLFTATNWAVGPYAEYNTSNHKWGGGAGAAYNITANVAAWLRIGYEDGDVVTPSGNAVFQLPVNLTVFGQKITVTPLAYTGIGTSLSGLGKSNYTPQGLAGVGGYIRIGSFDLLGAYEKWTDSGDKVIAAVVYSF